jgi:hypothetical protein
MCLSPYRINALLVGPVEVECLLFCSHYKDDGWGHMQCHDSEGYPVCVDTSC